MATLTNPINAQNIVDRFADYVTATANAGISWGTDAVPFVELDVAYFGGTTGGRGISISGANVSNTPITASTIYDTLCAETQTYSNIRNLNALLNVTGAGGNSGSRPTAGIVYNNTAVAHLNTGGYRQVQINATNPSVSSGNAISAANLETLFDRLRTIYSSNYRATNAQIQVDVCHASCHSNCHGSRGRR